MTNEAYLGGWAALILHVEKIGECSFAQTDLISATCTVQRDTK
jgi:hypothetical protein